MNIHEYGRKVRNYINNLTDEEFYNLLLESGLEKCPYEDGEITTFEFSETITYKKTMLYSTENESSFSEVDLKVA